MKQTFQTSGKQFKGKGKTVLEWKIYLYKDINRFVICDINLGENWFSFFLFLFALLVSENKFHSSNKIQLERKCASCLFTEFHYNIILAFFIER